jgi:hypothetical protein
MRRASRYTQGQTAGDHPSRSLHVMYRKSQRQSPKILAFLEFMKESMAAFDPEGLTIIHNAESRFAYRLR